jgi:hypothetical protein
MRPHLDTAPLLRACPGSAGRGGTTVEPVSESGDGDTDLSELIARLQHAARPVQRPVTRTPNGRPAWMRRSTAATSRRTNCFGQKLDSPDVCSQEAWYCSHAIGVGGNVPWSIWCGRQKGHPGGRRIAAPNLGPQPAIRDPSGRPPPRSSGIRDRYSSGDLVRPSGPAEPGPLAR